MITVLPCYWKWQLVAAGLSEAFWDRAERLTGLRREEQRRLVSRPAYDYSGRSLTASTGTARERLAMGIFGLIRDMHQDDEITTITRRIRRIEERLEKLEALVRALAAKLDRPSGEGPGGS